MSTLLKDRFFTPSFLQRLGDAIGREYPAFDRERFFALVFDADWQGRELIDRMHHVARVLGVVLPPSFPEALELLGRVAPVFSGFEGVLLSDFVAMHGEHDWERSMRALEFFTRFGSAEFAVRGFIVRDPEAALARLMKWTGDPNEHVRRLASEGCRPILPWGKVLREFRKDPHPLIPILERLKDDPSEYVRRSVANNLNDISKDHPDLAMEIGRRWIGRSQQTDAIVKHALRTLLKKGDPRAMALFGFDGADGLGIGDLRLEPYRIPIGGSLAFSFDLHVAGEGERRVRLEYAVDYVKSSGALSTKVFQIAERTFAPGVFPIARRQSLVDRSTRKHFPGIHGLTIIVNGIRMQSVSFEVE